jgi:serine/threonine protein kinase
VNIIEQKFLIYGFAYAFNDRVTDVSSHIFGGNLDPEYTGTYIFTEKSDMYAFGVLLVELMSGRFPIDPDSRLEERITEKWVCICFFSPFIYT